MPVITFGNFKGGVSKTTTSVMTSFELATFYGFKTLYIDTDPQASGTHMFERTYYRINDLDDETDTFPMKQTLMVGLSNGDLKQSIVNITDNLDIIPSSNDTQQWDTFIMKKFPPITDDYEERQYQYFKDLIDPLRNDYDFIIIDTPPALDIRVSSALYASDYINIVLQLEQASLDGAAAYYQHLQLMYDSLPDCDFDVLGIVPVMMTRDSSDHAILTEAPEIFGPNALYNTVVPHMARLKKYSRLGIADITNTKRHNYDFHDMKPHIVYRQLVSEILERSDTDYDRSKAPNLID